MQPSLPLALALPARGLLVFPIEISMVFLHQCSTQQLRPHDIRRRRQQQNYSNVHNYPENCSAAVEKKPSIFCCIFFAPLNPKLNQLSSVLFRFVRKEPQKQKAREIQLGLKSLLCVDKLAGLTWTWREREREGNWEEERVWLLERDWVCVYVCVCVCERERERDREWERFQVRSRRTDTTSKFSATRLGFLCLPEDLISAIASENSNGPSYNILQIRALGEKSDNNCCPQKPLVIPI